MSSKKVKPSIAKPQTGTASTKAKKTASSDQPKVTVKWTEDLIFKLLNGVEDNTEIRQGLYPGTGANASTANGGGKAKTEFYWQLAIQLFTDHPVHGGPFEAVRQTSTKKLRGPWVLKVKNQLNSMAEEVRKHEKALGETGQGIMSEDEIDKSANTKLARSWAEVEKVCPWYFCMKRIIGERPNMRPVGIGNSASELDLGVFTTPGGQDEASGPEDAEAITPSECDEDDKTQPSNKNKRSASAAGLNEDVKPKSGTPARPNTSKMATGSKPKKVKGYDDLTEIAIAEEATHQKELDLSIQRSKDKVTMVQAKVQAKAELHKVILEAKMGKARQTHEENMMKMQLELARIQRTPLAAGGEVGDGEGSVGKC